MGISINVKSLILYIAVLIASLVFASFYGGPLVYAWLYAILLMLPLSGVYIFLNYRYLRIFQEIDLHRVSKNEDHRYRAIIENAGILPIHRMRLGTFSDRCDLYEMVRRFRSALWKRRNLSRASAANTPAPTT